MKAIDVARLVKKQGVHVFRARKDDPGEYDAKPFYTGSRTGWIALDAFSASAVVAVHDGLNETNRVKFAAMPLVKMALLAFKLINHTNAA